MHKRVIKYFFLMLILINLPLPAQENESGIEQTVNSPALLQNSWAEKKQSKEIYLSSVAEIMRFNKDINPGVFIINKENELQNKNGEPVFNLLSSSFRNNIRFGGFWDKYAIINFTPSVLIKPASFINIYANHNYSCFVPMNGIKEHVKLLFIQGAAVLAVDNTIKLLFSSEDIIPKIAGFVFKTLIITELMKNINKNKSQKLYEYKTFRYSVSIRL